MSNLETTIHENKMRIHTPTKPGQTVEIELIGNVGDWIVAIPTIFGSGPKNRLSLPSGEEIVIPYVFGRITEITPRRYRDNYELKYKFSAYIATEEGFKIEINGSCHSPISTIDKWEIFPRKPSSMPLISDYRAYTRYKAERDAAFEAFRKEWAQKNPMKLD